jgi:hypothetical protein
VALVQPAERQARPADQAQGRAERRRALRRRAPAEPALAARQGRAEQALRLQGGGIRLGKGSVLVQRRRAGGDGGEEGAQPFEREVVPLAP